VEAVLTRPKAQTNNRPAAASASLQEIAPSSAPRRLADMPPETKDARATTQGPPPPTAWEPVTSYAFDAGTVETPWVVVSVSVPGVRAEDVACDFGVDSFDLRITRRPPRPGLRFRRDALDRDVVPAACRVRVKPDRVVLKLRKKPAEGLADATKVAYPQWADLAKKGGRKEKEHDRAPRHAGSRPYEVAKKLFELGDDGMKQRLGEAYLRCREREQQWGPDPLKGIFGDQDAQFEELFC